MFLFAGSFTKFTNILHKHLGIERCNMVSLNDTESKTMAGINQGIIKIISNQRRKRRRNTTFALLSIRYLEVFI